MSNSIVLEMALSVLEVILIVFVIILCVAVVHMLVSADPVVRKDSGQRSEACAAQAGNTTAPGVIVYPITP